MVMRMSKKAVLEGKKEETQEEAQEVAQPTATAKAPDQNKEEETQSTATTASTYDSPTLMYRCRYGASVILIKDHWAAKALDTTYVPVWAWLDKKGNFDRLLSAEELIEHFSA